VPSVAGAAFADAAPVADASKRHAARAPGPLRREHRAVDPDQRIQHSLFEGAPVAFIASK
jgi:hypothetical protein